jgi:hypothetical protein
MPDATTERGCVADQPQVLAHGHHPRRRIFHPSFASTRCDWSCRHSRAPSRLICVHDLPHLFPLPKERTSHSQVSVWRMILPPIPPPDLPRNQRTILLLPGGEGRDEGERDTSESPVPGRVRRRALRSVLRGMIRFELIPLTTIPLTNQRQGNERQGNLVMVFIPLPFIPLP